MRHPEHARYLVRLHYGRATLPCRYFESYRAASAYAGTLRRASVRLLLTEGEARALYVLACVALFALFVHALGA